MLRVFYYLENVSANVPVSSWLLYRIKYENFMLEIYYFTSFFLIPHWAEVFFLQTYLIFSLIWCRQFPHRFTNTEKQECIHVVKLVETTIRYWGKCKQFSHDTMAFDINKKISMKTEELRWCLVLEFTIKAQARILFSCNSENE